MKARWRVLVEAARDEALLAVDLFNAPRRRRSLSGFYTHMHNAWQSLLQAEYVRKKAAGGPARWALGRAMAARYPAEHDPVRANLEFTLGLRGKIVHRYQEAIGLETQGHAQALILNFEEELTTMGAQYSLGDALRVPVYLLSVEAPGPVPEAVREYIEMFEAGLPAGTLDDDRYTYQLSFTPRRERLRSVAALDLLRPGVASREIEQRIPFRFSVYAEFPSAWHRLQCRPPARDPNPERTLEQYCVYDVAHGDYLYTQDFVEKVVAECATAAGFTAFLGRDPVLKPAAAPKAS
jgi:hypothetical protein